uniref:Uncharacterized protein n=1 Tax=Clytia hemisphaerica TaxID=252671 RepID=A0A7M5X6I5_9CNID|eukprot:TCONS_00001407-protein
MEYNKIYFILLVVSATIKDSLLIKCYDCSGTHAYCNNTRKTKTCDGPQYSCLLRSGSTKIRVLKNGALDFEVFSTVTKTCAVESSSYCVTQKEIDPKMLTCKAVWCYEDGCNFNMKQANRAGQTSQANEIDPYGWYKTWTSSATNATGLKLDLTFYLCLISGLLIFLE